MGATVSIDTGGTFTDGYFTRGDRSARVKVDTTPHDLTEGLARCVAQGATALGYPGVQALLLDTDAFRFSSTIGTNSIIQRSGPRVGLMVSTGAGTTLYGDGPSPIYDVFLRRDLVVEISDPHDRIEVKGAVRRLLVGGARVLVASLAGSEADPGGEQAIKKTVYSEYPRHYLGAVPCLVASDVTPRPGAARRTATAVIDAYLYPDMVKALYKADEDLRAQGYPHPLLIVHASGSVARVAKTRAIETYSSGPVGGVYGSARLAHHQKLRAVVTMDIGGTSTDVSIINDAQVPSQVRPQVAGIDVHTPRVRVDAVGGGGGSIARRAAPGVGGVPQGPGVGGVPQGPGVGGVPQGPGVGGVPKWEARFTVGPDSAGAVPGPACYGLGGTQATVTDAEVVLGHLDPAWFLGGRRRLDPDRARMAIERLTGKELPGGAGVAPDIPGGAGVSPDIPGGAGVSPDIPGGAGVSPDIPGGAGVSPDISVEEAAWAVHQGLVDLAAGKVAEVVAETDVPAGEVALFAFGGAGGLVAAEVVAQSGLAQAWSFVTSAVFSAFGIAGMPLGHTYETAPGPGLAVRLAALADRAALDVAGEGFDPAELSFRVGVDHTGGHLVLRAESGWDEVAALVVAPVGEELRAVRLQALVPIASAPVVRHPPGPPAEAARKGKRDVWRPGGWVTAAVYDRGLLAPGATLSGPALVEGVDTTIVVPEGFTLTVDEYATAVLEAGKQ